MAEIDVSREQVIAYRFAAQQFDRSVGAVEDLAVLDIGVQDAAGEQARLAFDARLADVPPADAVGPGRSLALLWSLRGAPHVHRRDDLDALAAALYPLSEADAAQRLNETGPSIRRRGMPALDQYATAVSALRTVVRKPTAKGAASTAVTKAIPKAMWRECRSCKTSHISDPAMRVACLPAGLELQPGTAPPVLQRRPKAKRPNRADRHALAALARRYLTLLGPGTPAHVAGYLDGRRADVEQAWPDDLVEIRVGRTPAWLPAECVSALQSAPPPDLVRLLSSVDPYLQARDRDLIVPDKAVQKALWPVLGRPGAVFVDGEVAGTWRPKTSGAKLTVQVAAFARLPTRVTDRIEAEAERVAAARGLQSAGVRYGD